MGRAVFPPCCLTWGQTMAEVMKIMTTSFKRSHACTAALSTPNPAAGHCWSTPLLETPGNPQASLGQSLLGLLLFSPLGSLLLSPGSWCAQGLSEHSKCLWWVWGLILNKISPLLLSCWSFSFALECEVSFSGGIQHSPVRLFIWLFFLFLEVCLYCYELSP